MNEKILKTLLKRATGYTKDEVVEEYNASGGEMELVKRKVTKKYYPPDNAALKTYIELSGLDDDLSALDSHTLMEEKMRLLKELKEKENDD
ncbi:MAG: hypothetical protein ACI4MT_05810 [Christensenellales bacterium]